MYELNHSAQTGLGPVYNATACVSCHENPNSGGAAQITELRVGHNDANGNFVNPISTPSFNGAQSISNGIQEPVGDTALDQQVYETKSFCTNWTWTCLQRNCMRQLPR